MGAHVNILNNVCYMSFLHQCALVLNVFSSGSWSVNVLWGKLNSDGESEFSTFGSVFLTFKRIVSDVGKSHISIRNVKLLAFNTHNNREVFVGQ